MRILILSMTALLLSTWPSASQSKKANCRELLTAIAERTAAFRAITDSTNQFPISTVASSLSEQEKERAEAAAETHAELRPILTKYAEQLEDLTYSLQTCLR